MSAQKRKFAVASFTGLALVSAIFAAAPSAPPAPATRPSTTAVDPLPVLSTAPQASRKNIATMPYSVVMPPAAVSHDPRRGKKDGLHALARDVARGVPPLAFANPPMPADAQLPAAPPLQVASPDPAALPVADIAQKPDTGRATAQTDPTQGLTRNAALDQTPPPRKIPPPSQFLAIPDPSHRAGDLPTPAALHEDPPATNIDVPAAVTLPVK